METLKQLLLAALLAPCIYAQSHRVDKLVDANLQSLVVTYKQLHAAPELSHYEEKTAAFLAGQLRALGFTVTCWVLLIRGSPFDSHLNDPRNFTNVQEKRK